MISYLSIAYIAFIVFLIVKNYRSRNIIWLCIMLAGFCLALFGLASYTEYIYNSVYYTDSMIFQNIAKYIWILNYYLNLDIFNDYRIMNIGVAFYIYGALCFPVSYLNNHTLRKKIYIFLPILPLTIITIYDPNFLSVLLGLNTEDYMSALYNKQNHALIYALNYIFNIVIKISIVLSIAILIYVLRIIIPIIRKKFIYMIIGIVPIHVLFFVLFYWFPNHKIIFSRYMQLTNFSLEYNEYLYGFITYFALISILLVTYAMFRYNIFEVSIRKNKVTFQRQMNTAHIGLKVFSHAIKNQIIAVRLLSEQLLTIQDDKYKENIIHEIISICTNSVDKLSSSSQEMGIVKLRYEYIDINELLKKITKKNAKVNSNVSFSYEEAAGLFIHIDVKQFEKVMDNLIINAVEACKNIGNPKIRISAVEKDNYVIISVSDNGTGIEKKYIKKIFEPFFSTKPMSSNWGIGLSFCQKIVEAFGGVIEVESELYRGTEISMYIPNIRR